jgi:DNA helicase IV
MGIDHAHQFPANQEGFRRQYGGKGLNDVVFSPGPIGKLLSGSGTWDVRLTGDAFNYRTAEREICVPLDAIWQVRCTTGLFWAVVEVEAAGGTVELRGMANGRARHLSAVLERRVTDVLMSLLEFHRGALGDLQQALDEFLDRPHYLAQADLAAWAHANEVAYGTTIAAIEGILKRPFFRHHPPEGDLIGQARRLIGALHGDGGVLVARNEALICREMAACGDFFDTVETTPLTPEQRKASVVMEDRNLLVASAGSGKTSTVVGKVGYALLRGLVAPEEVLIVAFNAHAAREIEERVHERLAAMIHGPGTIKARTFHALGLEIIAEVEEARPAVAGGGDDDQVIGEIIADLVAEDERFASAWAQFNALYPVDIPAASAFDTVEAWHAHLTSSGNGARGRDGFRTLNGELARSGATCAIANWFFMNRVEYCYAIPRVFLSKTGRRRQYSPDFYLPAEDVYLLHHLIDADGDSSGVLKTSLADCQAWLRALPEERRARVIETHFSEYASGDLFRRIEDELAGSGTQFEPLSTGEVLEQVGRAQPRQQEEAVELVQAFVKHARSSQMTSEALGKAADAHPSRGRAALFVRIATTVLDRYVARLKEKKKVDFEDMILKAARYAREGRYRHGFRLILVDEFQDISRARADLLLGLLGHAPACKLFAVGDDWQSIYRFAGSDISLFTGFDAHFGKTATNFLTRTFRSNQGIAEVAAHFVQQNSAQIRKQVVALDPTREATVVVRRYRRRTEAPRYIEACLEEMAEEAVADGKKRTVYILGRYRRLVPEDMEDWQARYQPALEIDYRTIHGSKGLQADYVILIGLDSGGFPSERADDSLLNLVMPELETHPCAEERRLLYVALTRARHRAYLLGSKRSPSAFLTELVERDPATRGIVRIADELEEGNGTDSEPCPLCGVGRLVLRNGAHGPFYGCSEFPVCRHTARALDRQ